MAKTLDASISFDELMSAAAERFSQMHNALQTYKARVSELEKKVSDHESEIESLEEMVSTDCIDNDIDTGIGVIGYKAPNLQNQMIMELLEDLIVKNGCHKVLQALESLNIQ